MKTTTIRDTADRRAPRFQSHIPTPSFPSLRPDRAEQAWPGLTRAELREHIIEMIG